MSSFYRQQLESYLAELDVDAETVLDIGGGQKNARGRTKRWVVQKYIVMDLPKWDLNEFWLHRPQADLVFVLEVFEYLLDDLQAMQNVANCLKPEGRAIVSFGLIYPTHNEVEFDSRRYTETGIRRLAESAGLKIDKVHYRRDKSGLLQAFYSADGMRAAKGADHSITGYICEFIKE